MHTLFKPDSDLQSMSSTALKTAFYDAMFNDAGIGINPLEQKALENVRAILNDPAKLSSHIPPLPVILMQLLELVRDPNADFDKMSTLIEQDPALAAQVLKVANSPLYGSGVEIKNLPAAIGRLGVPGVASIASTIMMEKIRPPKPIYYKMFGRQIWVHSLQCAFLCKGFAKSEGDDEFSGHFLGLIHDVGKIIIFNCLTDALSSGIMDGQPGSKVFKDTMSEMSTDISSIVAREWKLPEKYCIALEEQRLGTNTPLSVALKDANLCAELYLLMERKKISQPKLEQWAENQKFDQQVWLNFLEKAAEIEKAVN